VVAKKVFEDDVRSLLESGKTLHQVAAQIGVSYATVQRAVRDFGIKLELVPRSKINIAAMKSEWGEGLDVHEIAARHKVSTSRIYQIVRSEGWLRRPRGKANPVTVTIDEQEFRRQWNDLVSVSVMSETFGVSATHIYRIKARLGLPERLIVRKKATHDRIRILAEKGYTQSEIVKATGFDRTTVRTYCDAAGIKLTTRGERALLDLQRRAEMRQREQEAPAKPTPKPKPEAQRFFTPLHARVLRTKGRWSALAEIATQEGLRMAQVQRIWHEVRVG
jgi:transposase